MLIALGFWQLDRAEEKRREQQTIESRIFAKPLTPEEVLGSPRSLDFQRIHLEGNYLAGRSIFLVNTFYRGQAGYEVLTPFETKPSGRIFIVSRGWMPHSPQPGNKLPDLETPDGEIHLIGTIHVPAGRSFFVDRPIRDGVWPLRLHSLDMKQIDRLFAAPVFPYVVRLDETMPGVLLRYWPLPNTHAGRSLSYAVQWFAMALLVLLVTVLNCTNLVELIRSRLR